jgi:hypothetical protein
MVFLPLLFSPKGIFSFVQIKKEKEKVARQPLCCLRTTRADDFGSGNHHFVASYDSSRRHLPL